MTWTAPTTRSTGYLFTASNYNTDVVNNLIHLKDPNFELYQSNETGDYTVTSTSFADVDGAGSQLTLTITLDVTADLAIGFQGSWICTSGTDRLYLDVDIDGVKLGGDDGLIGARPVTTAAGTPISFVVWKLAASSGAHTVKLQAKVSGSTHTLFAGAGTSNGDLHPQFWVKEMS